MKNGAPILGAFVNNHPAMNPRNLPGVTESESQAPTGRSSGIEWIEQMAPRLGGHQTWSIIGERHLNSARLIVAKSHHNLP